MQINQIEGGASQFSASRSEAQVNKLGLTRDIWRVPVLEIIHSTCRMRGYAQVDKIRTHSTSRTPGWCLLQENCCLAWCVRKDTHSGSGTRVICAAHAQYVKPSLSLSLLPRSEDKKWRDLYYKPKPPNDKGLTSRNYKQLQISKKNSKVEK
jgi:hypothetical protein